MGNAIKDRYNYESLRKLALDIKSVYSDFQTFSDKKTMVETLWKQPS